MSQQSTLLQYFQKDAKQVPNPHPESKKSSILRKKRNLDIIERNYILRRFYKPIDANNEYEMESKTYSILNHFDFDSPPYNKFSCIKNISANAFWFLFCSNYFPYLSNELIDQKEYIPEELKKLIDCLNSNLVPIKKNSPILEKFNFIKELKKIVQKYIKKKNTTNEKSNIFQTTSVNSSSTTTPITSSNSINIDETKNNINISNLSCTSSISSIKALLENLIKYFEHENESKLVSKITKDFILTNNFNRDIRVPEDFELDIKYHTKSFKRLREEILDNEEQDEEDENDDIVCYVCGDGEYEDDNLILYCSKCNMTVHQKCYGILVIPEEDWICHLCKAFNDVEVSKNMECILCPKLGGAMKPCTLKKSSHSYKIMIKNRKSPSLKDNNFKNINLNNNLINFISNEIKDEKNADNNKITDNKINNDNNNDNILINENNKENISNTQISQISKPPIINELNNNEINSNNINNSPIFNSPINLPNNNNNNNNAINNNINNINNISSRSLNSSNIIKETESIYSNSSINNTKKEEKFESNTNLNLNSNINLPNPNSNNKKHSQKKQKTEIYLNEKIAKENAWVHLSCALWLPEISIKNFDLKEKIQGVENISKKRLQEKCDICLKIGYGPTIKCEKCDYRFHPECARRLKRFYLEINENDNSETTFLAYCHGDAPPKHLKKYELIKQRKRDDIKKFSNLIWKDLGNLTKIPEDKQCNILNPYCHSNNSNGNNILDKKGILLDEKKILKKLNNNDNYLNNDLNKKNNINVNMKIELSTSEKNNLINAIKEMLIDESNLTLEINSEDYSIKQNNNINLTFEDIAFPEKFSWALLKETQEYLNGISTFETFKIYQSIITNKFDFAKKILGEKKIIIPKKSKMKQKKKKEEVYCSCRKIVPLVDWIACDSGDKRCPGKGWYHITHIPELKDYDRISFENTFDKYYCPKCRERHGLQNVLKNNEGNNINNNEIKDEKENKKEKDINSNDNNNEYKKEKSKEIECVSINDSNNNISINENNNSKMEIEEENIKEENKEEKQIENKEENNKENGEEKEEIVREEKNEEKKEVKMDIIKEDKKEEIEEINDIMTEDKKDNQ